MLMSFVGSIGYLMTESGLADIMEAAFGGVVKMLIGKKFPQNVRALRIVVEESLRKIICNNPLTCMNDLIVVLEELANKSRTTRLWVDCLIKPVFKMMIYVRAEREGD